LKRETKVRKALLILCSARCRQGKAVAGCELGVPNCGVKVG
jgi:hypothetical protein